MKRTFHSVLSALRNAFTTWFERDPYKESAAIAFNAVFALPGLLVVVFALGGYFFGNDAITGHLHKELTKVMGMTTADQVNEMILMAHHSENSFWATIIAIASIITGSTGVFIQLQKSLNTIWDVKAEPSRSVITEYLKKRLFSFGLILSIAFLLLISLVINSLLSALSYWIEWHWTEDFVLFISFLNVLISLISGTFLFALMFRILPDAEIKWKPVLPGALFTAILFELGKYALSFYFGHANPGSGYGAAGSIILIMLWASYSAMIVLFGAVLTRTISDQLVGPVVPEKIAVRKKRKAS